MNGFEDLFLDPERPRSIRFEGVKMGTGTLRERVQGGSVNVSPDILDDFEIRDTHEIVDLMILDFPPSLTGPPGTGALKKFGFDEEWEPAGVEHLVALANALDQDDRFDEVNQRLGLDYYMVVALACSLTIDGWKKRLEKMDKRGLERPLILRGTLGRLRIQEDVPMFWQRVLLVRKSRA